MADDDLRRLERGANRGDPAACVALARALTRAGRRDDALVALRPAWRDRDARAELTNAPAWPRERGPDRTAYLDVRPIRTAPRLLWHLPDPGAMTWTCATSPIGGDLGLIAYRGRELRVDVLDPDTGTVRASTPIEARPHLDARMPRITLAGDVLLVHHDEGDDRSTLRAIEPASGADLYRLELALEPGVPRLWELRGATPPGAAASLRLPRWLRHQCGGYTVQGHGLLVGMGGRPRRGPSPSVRLEPAREVIHVWKATVRPEDRRHAAIDRATGAMRWKGEGLVIAHDDGGALLWHDRELALRRADGAIAWRRAFAGGSGEPLALAPEAVVVRERAWPHLLVLERATGQVVADLGPQHAGGPPYRDPVVVVARDVVYVAYGDGRLAALTLSGERLWSVSLHDLARDLGLRSPFASRLHSLVPATDRLFARAAEGTIYGFGPGA